MDLYKHQLQPAQLPLVFEEVGLREIQINALNMFYAIDDARNSLEKKVEIIEADRQNDLEVVEIAFNHMENHKHDKIKQELVGLINNRYDRRINSIQRGEKPWDFKISTLMIVRGIK